MDQEAEDHQVCDVTFSCDVISISSLSFYILCVCDVIDNIHIILCRNTDDNPITLCLITLCVCLELGMSPSKCIQRKSCKTSKCEFACFNILMWCLAFPSTKQNRGKTALLFSKQSDAMQFSNDMYLCFMHD